MIHVPRFATRSIMIMYLYIADIVYICLYIVYTVPYCNILCLYNGPESSSVGKFESLPKDEQTEPDQRLQVWLKRGFTRYAFHGSFWAEKGAIHSPKLT